MDRRVLLFKAEKGKETVCSEGNGSSLTSLAIDSGSTETVDAYADILSSHGYSVYFAPVLSYRYNATNLERFKTQLAEGLVSSIVITSPRAADAAVSVLNQIENAGTFDNVRWYVVGNETRGRLQSSGIDAQGSEAGIDIRNASELAKILIEHQLKTVTFLCGDKRRDTLPRMLSENGISLEEICVYESVPAKKVHIPDEYLSSSSAIDIGGGDDVQADRWCVFFSPSGVKCMSENDNYQQLVQNYSQSRRVKSMAIGKTTAEEIRKEKYVGIWNLEATAKKPSPQGVLDALTSYYTEKE